MTADTAHSSSLLARLWSSHTYCALAVAIVLFLRLVERKRENRQPKAEKKRKKTANPRRVRKKERKQTTQGRDGRSEDGTPPPHRDFI